MDLKLVFYYILMAIFIWEQASLAVKTYDDLYVGCFKDEKINRVLPDALLISDNMTIEVCIDHCKGFNGIDSAYAGVEFGKECFCGVAGTDYSRLGVAERSDCYHTCAGDNTTYCGGSRRISIYNLLLIRPQTTTETSSTSVIPTSPDASTIFDKRTEESSTRSGSGLVPTLIYILLPLFAIAVIVLLVCFLCRRKGLKHGSSQGIATSGELGESPAMKDNPTFQSSDVHDLRLTDVAGCHSGNDPYMALTTPHDGPTLQVYEPLREVISQGDGYEVPVNGINGPTGPEYCKTLHKLQVHHETDYEITHEYQDLTNSVVGRNNSRDKSPIRWLQAQPETNDEITHEYQDPGVVGENIPQYESHINGLQEMSETDYEAIHEYEDPGIIG